LLIRIRSGREVGAKDGPSYVLKPNLLREESNDGCARIRRVYDMKIRIRIRIRILKNLKFLTILSFSISQISKFTLYRTSLPVAAANGGHHASKVKEALLRPAGLVS